MKKILIVSFFMALNLCVYAQNTLNAVVKNSETKETLVGVTASVKGTSIGATSNENGQIKLSNIPDGLQEIHFSYLGFEEFVEIIKFPFHNLNFISNYHGNIWKPPKTNT